MQWNWIFRQCRVTQAGGRISGAWGRTGGLCQQLCKAVLGVTATPEVPGLDQEGLKVKKV